jgi:hypothetical protein
MESETYFAVYGDNDNDVVRLVNEMVQTSTWTTRNVAMSDEALRAIAITWQVKFITKMISKE